MLWTVDGASSNGRLIYPSNPFYDYVTTTTTTSTTTTLVTTTTQPIRHNPSPAILYQYNHDRNISGYVLEEEPCDLLCQIIRFFEI